MNQPNNNEAPDPGQSAYLTRASLLDGLRAPSAADREAAWREFESRYAPVIAGFSRNCGANPQDVDDIIQDVMAAFVGTSDQFAYDPAKGRFRGWLKTCTVRAAIRRAGKNLRHRGVPLEELPEPEVAVDGEWNDFWEQQLVARALGELRRESGNSVAFRCFEQYALREREAEEVAAELGTSVNNVHQSKSRMTKRLRSIVRRIRESDP